MKPWFEQLFATRLFSRWFCLLLSVVSQWGKFGEISIARNEKALKICVLSAWETKISGSRIRTYDQWINSPLLYR